MENQQCVNCERRALKTTLVQNCGLCERCEMSVDEELMIHGVYAEASNQMCEALFPSGRPCWEQAKMDVAFCTSKDCRKRKMASR